MHLCFQGQKFVSRRQERAARDLDHLLRNAVFFPKPRGFLQPFSGPCLGKISRGDIQTRFGKNAGHSRKSFSNLAARVIHNARDAAIKGQSHHFAIGRDVAKDLARQGRAHLLPGDTAVAFGTIQNKLHHFKRELQALQHIQAPFNLINGENIRCRHQKDKARKIQNSNKGFRKRFPGVNHDKIVLIHGLLEKRFDIIGGHMAYLAGIADNGQKVQPAGMFGRVPANCFGITGRCPQGWQQIQDGPAGHQIQHTGHILPGLKIKVNDKDFMFGQRKSGCHIDGNQGFPDAAFTAKNSDRFTAHLK